MTVVADTVSRVRRLGCWTAARDRSGRRGVQGRGCPASVGELFKRPLRSIGFLLTLERKTRAARKAAEGLAETKQPPSLLTYHVWVESGLTAALQSCNVVFQNVSDRPAGA